MITASRYCTCLGWMVAANLVFLPGAQRIGAQQTPPRQDSVPLRADYRDLDELLQKLPLVQPPTFDETRALAIGSLPLACLDRLQSRPGGRAGGGAARGGGRGDTTSGRDATGRATTARGAFAGGRGAADSTVRDTTGRAATAGRGAAGGGGGSGAGYYWVPSYTLIPDHDRTRAFWGCTDWHSAVSSTWVTARLLKSYPRSPLAELSREKLNAHLGRMNLEGELAFFRTLAAAINPIPSASRSGALFERPYGFAWLLKLHSELLTWPDSQAKRWAANTAPLAAWMADSLAAYFVALLEPVRAGSLNNTALSMTLALDYADATSNSAFRARVVPVARKFFLADKACATQSERAVSANAGRAGGRGAPAGRGGRGADSAARADSIARAATTPNDLTAAASRGRGAGGAAGGAGGGGGGGGTDIHSPCLTEAALMARVLAPSAYTTWLATFLPPLQSGRFAPLTEPAPIAASDSAAPVVAANATERARLGALSFARAFAMERIARALRPNDPQVPVWHRLSALHADRGFQLMKDDTAGTHWVPAWSLLYTTARQEPAR